jgi:hypothetical protein
VLALAREGAKYGVFVVAAGAIFMVKKVRRARPLARARACSPAPAPARWRAEADAPDAEHDESRAGRKLVARRCIAAR